jgi:dolichyl-phosphate-mannose-protein mannosyltransferase
MIRFVLLIAPLMIIFVLLFIVHLDLLPLSGTGDDFMSRSFRARLLDEDGNSLFSHIRPKPLLHSLVELIAVMYTANAGLTATHPFQSFWYNWIFNNGRILLYWQDIHGDYGMWIWGPLNPVNSFFGTIVGVAGAILLIFWFFVSLVLPFGKRLTDCFQFSFVRVSVALLTMLVGYFGNILPYYFITRATWTYHYVPSFLLACILCGLTLQVLTSFLERYSWATNDVLKCLLSIGFVGITSAFIFFSPWTYALPLAVSDSDFRFISETWTWYYKH